MDYIYKKKMNSKNLQDQQDQIKKIIEGRYGKTTQSLDLSGKNTLWSQVLLSQDWSMLRKLYLNKCLIDDEGIKVFAGKDWSQLHFLSLCQNKITGKSIQIILYQCFKTSATSLKNIKILNIRQSKIGNRGIKWLVKINLPQLQKLNIQDCQIKGQGFKHMIKSRWPKLKSILIEPFDKISNNDMQLDGWSIIGNNLWKQLQNIIIFETTPIFCINFVLLQSLKVKISFQNHFYIKIKMKRSLLDVLERRGLFFAD